jgi:hypothetical protein
MVKKEKYRKKVEKRRSEKRKKISEEEGKVSKERRHIIINQNSNPSSSGNHPSTQR